MSRNAPSILAASQTLPFLRFGALYHSASLKIEEYDCSACRGRYGCEECSRSYSIVLLRRGVYRKRVGRREVTADVNQAVFHTRDAAYQISHPTDLGDHGTVLIPDAQLLHDLIRQWHPAVDDDARLTFPQLAVHCDLDDYWRHRELIGLLEQHETSDDHAMHIEFLTMRLLHSLLAKAFASSKSIAKKTRTQDDQRDRIEAAKTQMALQLGEQTSLQTLAQSVGMSPFHFARLFQQHTGLSVHQYLRQLRLRSALSQLNDFPDDLTALALNYGFSSHSHFSAICRQVMGKTPSQLRSRQA